MAPVDDEALLLRTVHYYQIAGAKTKMRRSGWSWSDQALQGRRLWMASNFSSSPKDCFATGKLRSASAGALYLCLCVCDVSRGGNPREQCGGRGRSVQGEHWRTQHQCRHPQTGTRRKEKCRRSKARGWDRLVRARLVNGQKPIRWATRTGGIAGEATRLQAYCRNAIAATAG